MPSEGDNGDPNECSRGLFPDKIMDNIRWLNGLAFFHQEKDAWPITVKFPEPSVEDPEVSVTNWIGLMYGPAEELRSLLEQKFQL